MSAISICDLLFLFIDTRTRAFLDSDFGSTVSPFNLPFRHSAIKAISSYNDEEAEVRAPTAFPLHRLLPGKKGNAWLETSVP